MKSAVPELGWIRTLYDYDAWANGKTLQAAAMLSPAAFVAEMKGSYASVRDTLVHIIAAEWIWLERWKGTSPKALLSASEFPTVESVRARLAEVEQSRAAFVEALTKEKLDAAVRYVNLRGETYAYPLWQQMLHVVNHSSYHRGQVTTLLRQQGGEPAATDLLIYFDEAQP